MSDFWLSDLDRVISFEVVTGKFKYTLLYLFILKKIIENFDILKF